MKIGNSSIKRGDIYWVNLDPTIGSEIKKTRPAVVISNDVQNGIGIRFIVAPVTSQVKKIYPFEAKIELKGKRGKVLLDQIRTIDVKRLGEFVGSLSTTELKDVNEALKLVLSIT